MQPRDTMVIKRMTIKAERTTMSRLSLNAEPFVVVVFTFLSKLEKLDSMVGLIVTTIFEIELFFIYISCEKRERKLKCQITFR